jgi:ATP-dependent RNA helicase DOB1
VQGDTFVEVCKMTDIFEGSIIRATRRLDELMGELATAAGVIGDVGLQQKFRDSAATIRRDIMFAASLYI